MRAMIVGANVLPPLSEYVVTERAVVQGLPVITLGEWLDLCAAEDFWPYVSLDHSTATYRVVAKKPVDVYVVADKVHGYVADFTIVWN